MMKLTELMLVVDRKKQMTFMFPFSAEYLIVGVGLQKGFLLRKRHCQLRLKLEYC